VETSILIAIVALILFVFNLLRQIERRLTALEKTVISLSQNLGISPKYDNEPSDEVRQLAALSGTYIEAIKTYREQSGADLKCAKLVIDNLKGEIK
jgi:ribosomal protein L7/L12